MNSGAAEESSGHFCAFGPEEPTGQKEMAAALILLKPWDYSWCPNSLLFNTVNHQILLNLPPK